MKDAAEILGEVVPKAAEWGKFARLIEPGNIVHNIDGRMYRIASRIRGPDGIAAFKLANLQGGPVPTPADFYPLSPAVAKFARWLRWIVAYRADFDRYVKDIIEAHGLPIDESWNWAKWFQARVAPQLGTRNEEIRDEAIHATIIRVLVEQDALGRFEKLIERFPKKVRREPLAKQVTIYLAHIFRDYEISRTNRWIEKTYPSKEVPMEQEDEEGEGYSLLDAPGYAAGAEAYEAVDADMDVAKFREGFATWLENRFVPKVAGHLIALFDIVWGYVREHGDRPPRRAIVPEWTARTGLTVDSLKQYIVRFAELVSQYRRLHPEIDVHPFIDVIQKVTQERAEREPKIAPAIASLEIAAAEAPGCCW
jgi:hypothetical protein